MESSFQNYYGEGTASAVSFFSSHIVSVNKTQSKGEKLMTIMNEGEIIINDKTRAGEVAQIFVAAGIYESVEKVPVYEDDGTTPEEAGISVHEVYGDIDSAIREAADKCKEADIILNGQICYSGDYDGRYYITNNVVEDLTADEIGVREASSEELIAELQRRGLDVMVQESKPSESSKVEDLPALYAYEIKWDTDGDQEMLDGLPKEIRIPDGMVDNEEISDYLSDETGFCHAGFKLGIMFRGKIMPYYTNRLDSDTFQMWFGEDILKDREGDSYLIKFEKHLKDNERVVEIIWEDDCTTINLICNSDDYITANEIWKIERICEKMIQPDSDEVPDTDGKENSAVELGKTYQFAGYKWTACELINKGKTLVIQSHGVTSGAWPGFVIPQFGNGNFYVADIDGEDISAYDDKMRSLYDAIKDAEDSSASYGKGLYLIPKEKAGFARCGEPGSGNYWKALKAAAENASSFRAVRYNAWLGTAYGGTGAWHVYRDGDIYHSYQGGYDRVVAPAFNLDLSKVEVAGDEIFIKGKDFTEKSEDHPDSYRSVWEYGFDFTKDGETFHLDPEMVSQIYEAITEDNGRNYVATYTSRKFTREQYIAICDEVENLLTNDSVEYRACEHVLGKGFDKE